MVKANWDTEELVENWTLLPQELELVRSKVGANQIGFAVLLKYFQIYARFPDSPPEIPDKIISYIAQQLQITSTSYSDYDWQGRSISNHRVSIRKLFGFRTATRADGEDLIDWLKAEILPKEQRIEPITELVYQRWRELQIEPPTEGRVERLIRSAIAQHETNFCHQTLAQLTPEIIEQIDILLSTEELDHTENVESEKPHPGKLKASDFAFTGLKGINTGINGENYQDLLYVRRRYIHKDQLHSAIAEVVNAIFEIRLPHIWGEGTTSCEA